MLVNRARVLPRLVDQGRIELAVLDRADERSAEDLGQVEGRLGDVQSSRGPRVLPVATIPTLHSGFRVSTSAHLSRLVITDRYAGTAKRSLCDPHLNR